ncbi:hypothetical protein [Oceaniglobus trochenteri]|uniref:hypothetical protein n=1 Tax=Oceaniglobus trochenteri TaxID=2763260 RepID=UPI001CFF9C05|nr:hypothetical protein [Oceaniglobus trochenteri]
MEGRGFVSARAAPYIPPMTPPDLNSAILAALAENPDRVQHIIHDGKTIWLKRRERLGPVRRLQKGDSARAFEAERAALHEWAALGAPAPRILAEGPEFFAMADSGRPLHTLMTDDAAHLPAFRAAARALADLHRRGLSHGRPSLKDICWDGEKITFLDLERYAPRRNTPKGHAMDLVMFVFNGLTVGRGMTPEMAAAIETYRAEDPAHVWEAARAWCHRMRWIDWLTKPIQMRGPGKAKEFKAIPLTLATFAAP